MKALGRKLGLARKLGVRSAPLLVALVAVVTVSAPTAYHVVHVSDLRERAGDIASELSRTLAVEAARRPTLWRYDSPKLVEHVGRIRRDPAFARIEVRDERGGLVAEDGAHEGRFAWERAPIGEAAGEVWVAVDLRRARGQALRLALPFFALALLLAALLWLLPRRAMIDAEAHIEALFGELRASQSALEALNRNLEAQVDDRVRDLEAANEALSRQEQRLRELTARAVSLQEAERRAIGRELHDGVGQMLTAVRLQVQVLPAPEEASARTLALLDRALEEVRGAVELLGPSVVHEVGVVESLRRLSEELEPHVAVDFHAPETAEAEQLFDALSPALETTLYRIAQEATHNALRHAQASRVDVTLELEDAMEDATARVMVLSVGDDGVGFERPRREGHGLRTMQERAELLGGEVTITSAPGHGTTVRATLPTRER